MKRSHFFVCWSFFFLAACPDAEAGKVDTISIYSASMHKDIPCVVITPDTYRKKQEHFPVVYLLHGYDGWYSNWILRAPELKGYADTFQAIIVCPDGAKSSWYFDSPVDSSFRYETYIANEVVGYIDAHYRTLPDKNHRGITGLSMGGHGAVFLALRHPDIFGAAASMSGGFDLNDSKRKFDISLRIGDTLTHAANWHDLSVIYMLDRYTSTPVTLWIDCGFDDIFIESNRRVHQRMLQLKIPHAYSERPGVHGWDYWRESLPYHLLFFRRFFQKSA